MIRKKMCSLRLLPYRTVQAGLKAVSSQTQLKEKEHILPTAFWQESTCLSGKKRFYFDSLQLKQSVGYSP